MFGEKLRKLRKEKKLTMKEFGEKFNLAESTISGYETGNRKPEITIIEKFADFFDVSVDYLLGREIKNTDDTANFEDMLDDPEFEIFFKELKGSPEENRRKALDFLKYLNEQEKK